MNKEIYKRVKEFKRKYPKTIAFRLKAHAKEASKFVDNGEIDPQTTIAQLIGGKYNHGRFGRMTGKAANRRNQIARLGGTAY